ncbi:DUF1289 domain-containing protein [Vibrio sp. TBV020]|uniref:DUF1289 domain-containing protein n=1 Tax=Vibrio sp. TBV020 TaxID=3137398 RepID=UPI0038CD5876
MTSRQAGSFCIFKVYSFIAEAALKAISNDEVTPPNPCIRHCCLDGDDICLGCFRTLQEILSWSQSTSAEKKAILEHCKSRRARKAP